MTPEKSAKPGDEQPEMLGAYRIEGLVRHRSELSTFRARHTELGRAVWLTSAPLSAGPNAAFDARLRKSAELLAGLGFDGVFGLIEVIEVAGRLVVITEAPTGQSLRALIDGRLEGDLADSSVAVGLARAAGKLHRQNVIHLALAPDEAFVQGDGHVKLAGLWDARRVGDKTEPRDVPEPGPHERYASPERFARSAVDRASDVFSLGAICYEITTGKHPFESAEGEASLVRRLRTEEVAPVEANTLLSQTLQKSLQKLPSLRYETADRFADDLVMALGAADVANELPGGRRLSAAPPRLVRQLAMVLAAMSLIMVVAWALDQQGPSPRSYPPGAASGNVRVLATPWADVFVDGAQVDTTPVGRPLRLAPGKHEISFRHPRAPEQRRTVDLAPGATITLDVQMDIQRPPPVGPDGSP